MLIVLWQGGESPHAGLAGDRTAFASKIRFAKKKKKKKKRHQTHALISPLAMVNDAFR